MKLRVEPMDLDDIQQVLEVDRESYTLPWPASAYRREVLHNKNAHYFVLRLLSGGDDPEPQPEEPRQWSPLPFFRWPLRSGESRPSRPGRIVGYAGMWMMVDEAHITTIAMREEFRGKGLGELLLLTLVEQAGSLGASRVTLEVRVTNEVAQSLYRKYGFRLDGRRKRYYSDNNEDAYIMTTEAIDRAEYQQQLDGLSRHLRDKFAQAPDVEVVAPALYPAVGQGAAERAE